MLVSELSACEADRMPSRSIVPVVTVERRWGRSPGWSPRCAAVASGCRPQGRVGPVQLGDLRGRAPGEVVAGGPGRAGRSRRARRRGRGRSGPRVRRSAPGAMAAAGCAASRRAASKARTAARKSPAAQARSASTSRSRCRKLSGASAARAASHRVTSSSSDSRPPRSSPSAVAGLPGEGQPAQQAGHGGRVVAYAGR